MAKRGPNTAEGKRAVSRNAIKHGILSADPVVIAGLETIEAWEQFESEIAESWQPVGAYERELARDIAFGLWRLRRCRINESAQISHQVDDVDPDPDDDEDADDDQAAEDDQSESPDFQLARYRSEQHLVLIPDGWTIDRILRYETHVRRSLLQTVHELEARQARRMGERTPLARVDFTTGPSLHRPPTSTSSTLQEINRGLANAERERAARKRALSHVDS